jgi:hypothetical protein
VQEATQGRIIFGSWVIALALFCPTEGVLELASFSTTRKSVAIFCNPLIYEVSDVAKGGSLHDKPQPPPVKLRLVEKDMGNS